MAEPRYDIYFSGQLIDGADPARVRQAVGRLFGVDGAALERLFSGGTIRVKAAVDQETAIKYRVAFRDAGALVEIRAAMPETPPAPPRRPEPAAQTAADDRLTLLPPMTGSLIDCAPPVQPQPLPDISAITIAPPGETIDTRQPPPPARIDTSGLTAAPANSGSLEECQAPKEPASIPDISQLRLVD